MSKEPAYPCHLGCGMMVAFPEYHLPHCPNNPVNLNTKKAIEAIESRLISAKSARLKHPGPVHDQRFSKRRKKMKP